ncbi:MAG: ATP-binding protein [Candidatus Thiodiazotropha sp.]|jgi:signal transduction histidine kinase/CheY-like chemotaxis protein
MKEPSELHNEIARLEERARKLALEKSWLQLMINLINRLSTTPGLQDTIDNMLQGIIEFIGGTNSSIYYFIDQDIYYADALGTKHQVKQIDDPQVNQALKKGEFIEFEDNFVHTMMKAKRFAKAWTWVYPLKVGSEIIGVFKMENMHIGVSELKKILPSFFTYAAMILKNEIFSQTRLQQAYDELDRTNQALLREIAERERYEQELERAKEAAEAANRAKSAFLANMSHELRTPLNAVLGFSELMAQDPEATPRQSETLDIINRSGRHLLTLINDVLNMSKIEAGMIQLECRPFDLGELVRDIGDMMRGRAEEKGLRLLQEQSSAFPRFVNADATKLRHILINLLGNAVKFTHQGAISLRLDAIPGADKQQLTLVCEVEDTGSGIALEDREKIFLPFVQVGGGSAKKGSGLGLAITRQFVELMGGEIQVKSELGKGSIFRFEVPVALAKVADIPEYEPRPGHVVGLRPGQQAYRQLIVEDQMESRLLISRVLADLGLPVREVPNGLEAVEQFRQWQPRLIWMDHRMPVMDGVEATQRIRQLPGGGKVRIVALTASAFEEEQEKFLQAGMDAVIRKPFRLEEIWECLHQQLGLEYSYEVAKPATAGPQPLESISVEGLRSLPPDLLDALREKAKDLNLRETLAIIDKIATEDAELANSLRRSLEGMDFRPMLHMIDTMDDVDA